MKNEIKTHAISHIPGGYACHICNSTFNDRRPLRFHIREKHTLYSCTLCGKSGISKVAYKDHINTCKF